MASHRLEDDLGYSPVNEVRRVREHESAEDQEQESVTCIALIGCRRSETGGRGAPEDVGGGRCVGGAPEYAGSMPVGELTPNGCERVGHKDALGRGRGPLDERRVLFDCGRQLRPLKVEYCMFEVPKLDGGSQEDPIHRGFGEHNHISDDALNEGAIHRLESPPNAHDILHRQCDCFEPETGSRAVHPYLNGGDVGLTP
ncbi:hypothetical protein CRG98_000770 [Punica granatum]|uniref:Uncharacterized protein n=1 Tax=Punica granatum TaxID=22663 RepID=A0A2I0LDU2_PUNGR|nr:hypothetical protein CRG98_000770 [Punica granatum]